MERNNKDVIRIQRIPFDELLSKALEKHRQRDLRRFQFELQKSGMKDSVRSRIRFKYHPENANEDTLDPSTFYRWQLAYVRHELSNYDNLCRRLDRTDPADWKAYRQLRHDTFERISETYPELADACRKQMLIDTIHFSDLKS